MVLAEGPHLAQTQLPISAYFDEDFYAQEQAKIFKVGPQYIGHASMVPNVGDYHVLSHPNRRQFLKRTEEKIVLLSNICRHRQAIMLEGRGNSPNTTCPLHRWTYDNQGSLIAAPHFAEKPCLSLQKTELQTWNGLLFETNRSIAADVQSLNTTFAQDFSDYVFDRAEIVEYPCNWKTFIEVYQEDYHVDAFHPGLGRFVDCEQLQWTFSDWCSVQTVGMKGMFGRAGSSVYEKWHHALKAYHQDALPLYGAIWMMYYPNIMIEWYPQALVISTVIPDGPQKTYNMVEYFYPQEVVWFEPELIKAQQAAYTETAIEDREICLRIDAGRRALYAAQMSDVGPYQSPMEDGMRHFHQFIRGVMMK